MLYPFIVALMVWGLWDILRGALSVVHGLVLLLLALVMVPVRAVRGW